MTDHPLTQEEIDAMLDGPDDDCPNCDGSGWVDSCFEDTCVCLDPPCHQARCDWCNASGTKKAPPLADSHGPAPQKPAGPLLKLMEDE